MSAEPPPPPPSSPVPPFPVSSANEAAKKARKLGRDQLPASKILPHHVASTMSMRKTAGELETPEKVYRMQLNVQLQDSKTHIRPDPQQKTGSLHGHEFGIDIPSKVKYFEDEIEKENEGVRQNQKQTADLSRKTKQTWEQTRHGKYSFGKSIPCGVPCCPGGTSGRDGPGPIGLKGTDEPEKFGPGSSATTATERIVNAEDKIERSADDEKNRMGSKAGSNRTGKAGYATSDTVLPTTSSSHIVTLVPTRARDNVMAVVPRQRHVESVKRVSDQGTSTTESLKAVAIASEALMKSKASPVVPMRNNADFQQQLQDAGTGTLVVVKFFNESCLPCQKMDKIFRTLAATYPEVAFSEVDVDQKEFETVIADLEVGHIPSFYYFKNAAPVEIVEGEVNKSDLETLIIKYK